MLSSLHTEAGGVSTPDGCLDPRLPIAALQCSDQITERLYHRHGHALFVRRRVAERSRQGMVNDTGL